MRHVPLSKVYISDEIKQKVLEAIDSEQYILGPNCTAFEEELARYIGTQHCVLASNWTSAVHMLLLAMKLRPGDEVLVPSLTAFPTVEPVVHAGARPVFVDIDDSFTMDPDAAAAAFTPRTVGIIPVHLYGHAADLGRLIPLAQKHNLWLIEDCAQAHGSTFDGKRVGSMGLAGGFSFYPSKNLTCFGDGGCITTNDATLAAAVKKLRNHGRKDKDTHEWVGFNQRFNEIQAAVGRIQLTKLDELNTGRRRAADYYRMRLAGLPVVAPTERSYTQHVYHMFVIRTSDRDKLRAFLKSRGVETGIHYPIPNHQQPAMTNLYGKPPVLPRTEQAVKEILSLPMFPSLTTADQDYVVENISEFFQTNAGTKPASLAA
ncbi:MAG: DegT/DnrJ/EryC1/StrS family aminotransferase [Planctomycetes bacterium]|nr:DegT/DnrJ/EryC1/StrS family aminotransferase [Planctomycetota bacterium]